MTWNEQLRAAFEILLGRPLSAYDPTATYAAFYGGEVISELVTPDLWLTASRAATSVPTPLPDPVYLDEDHQDLAWEFDFSRSLFVVDDDELLTGAELAVGFTDDVTPLLRIATDGTLFDALRAATFTHLGPGSLLPMGGADGWVEKADPRWEEALAAVQPEALRDHLRFHCVTAFDARGSGALYLESEEWPPTSIELPDAELIAGWSFGEDQHGVAVVKLA